ncbi:sulfurtransferase complex subunit TusD [Reinekea forsetii]|nr:sulfurtransferase complex subunit TusD [Reinekea forsetii]
MRIQINVYSAPWSHQSSIDALTFARQCLQQGHELARVFFFFDGVYHGLSNQSPASDEFNFLTQWQDIHNQGVELLLCIAASANRGVLNAKEAQRYRQSHPSSADFFQLTGLGQWATGFHDCEKLIAFK